MSDAQDQTGADGFTWERNGTHVLESLKRIERTQGEHGEKLDTNATTLHVWIRARANDTAAPFHKHELAAERRIDDLVRRLVKVEVRATLWGGVAGFLTMLAGKLFIG